MKPGEITTISELLKEIKRELPNTNIEDLAKMIDISTKTYYNIIDNEKIKTATIDKLRGFMETRFSLSFEDLQNGKVQVVKKQIVNVKGNYTFSSEGGNTEQVNYLLKKLIESDKEKADLRNEILILKEKLEKYGK